MVDPRPAVLLQDDFVEGVGGCATGVAIGTLMWNGLFLGFSALGVMPPELAWVGIQATYALAAYWFLAMIALGARW